MFSNKRLSEIKEYAERRSLFDKPEDVFQLLSAYKEAHREIKRLKQELAHERELNGYVITK